jgi:hypothetical protein
MSFPEGNAPVPPKEALASLLPTHISVIAALSWKLPILDTIIPLGGLSDWHSNLRKNVDQAYIKELSVPPVMFISKLNFFVE